MRLNLLLVAASLALLAIPSTSSAALYGVQADGALVNGGLTPEQQDATLEAMHEQGATIVRVNLGWNEIAIGCGSASLTQLRDPDNGCYSWGIVDGLVTAAARHKLQLLVSASRAPQWLHGSSDTSYTGTTSSEWAKTARSYSAFMGAMAKRYTSGSSHGTIRLYTVWNEPNSGTFWKPMDTPILKRAAPRRFAQMVAMTAIAVKGANSSALVAVGPTGPGSTIKPIDYVREVQSILPRFLPGSGASERRYIAAWAHNPYPGSGTAPSRGRVKPPIVGMTNIRDLFTQLDKAAITRNLPVWATEFAYETNPPDTRFGIKPALQGRFIGESFDWLDSTNRVPVMIWYGFRDDDNVFDFNSGTYYADGTAKVSLEWWRRPVSLPIGVTRKGSYVRVWARSMVNPSATRIAVSLNGRTWRLLPAVGRKRDGTTVLRTRVTRTTFFATWDGTRGPARVVFVR